MISEKVEAMMPNYFYRHFEICYGIEISSFKFGFDTEILNSVECFILWDKVDLQKDSINMINRICIQDKHWFGHKLKYWLAEKLETILFSL